MHIIKTLILFIFLASSTIAHAFETTAKNAYVIDVATGAIMLDKGSDIALPPASMSKLMTLELLMKALKDGVVTLETQFPVSQRAFEMTGSKMFLEKHNRPTVDDLLKGIIVQSGNDACVVVAEGLGGSEEHFAELMTARAKELGLEKSTFGNASGWPHPRQRMSAKDLAHLAYHLEKEYPEYFYYFSIPEFTYNNIAQNNRNPMLGIVQGADGLKTGHTEESGYGLVGSVTRQGRRVIFVLMGMGSEAERAREAERVATWALSGFNAKTHNKAGDPILFAETWLADKEQIGLTTTIDFITLEPLAGANGSKVTAHYDGPLKAPVAAGTEVGYLNVESPNLPAYTVPLVTAEELKRGGLIRRYFDVVGSYANEAISQVTGG